MSNASDALVESESYRHSHSSTGYGARYQGTYTSGYYADHWRLIERDLLVAKVQALDLKPGASALDLACGTGRISAELCALGLDVTGVDISASMLEIARTNVSGARFVEQDLADAPPVQDVDLVTAFRLFLNAEHSLRLQALTHATAALRPGGHLICNIHVSATSPVGMAYRLRNRVTDRKISTVHRDYFVALLKDHKLEMVDIENYGYLPRVGNFYPGFVKRLMLPLEKAGQNLPPAMQRRVSHSYVVTARIQS